MNTVEIWKPIAGFEDLYEISNLGRVKSLNYKRTGVEKILKPGKDGWGYLKVVLCRDGKHKVYKVHRLVAEAFIPNPFGLSEINHINEDKTLNVVSNIEWASRRYNINFGTRTKRAAASRSKAVEASKYPDFRTIELRFSSAAEAERNGYQHGNVSYCCNGRFHREGNNKYKGLYWRFAS